MQIGNKREAIRAYKERKQQMGIYAVRCTTSGEAWVGKSRNLAAQQNRMWFALRLGSERTPGLQAAWNIHGPDAFVFELLAQLTDDETAYPEARLGELLDDWQARTGARESERTTIETPTGIRRTER